MLPDHKNQTRSGIEITCFPVSSSRFIEHFFKKDKDPEGPFYCLIF